MDYSKYSKVVEVRASYLDAYMKIGWELLFIGQYEDQAVGLAETTYSLGWLSDKGEPQNPPSQYGTLV